MNEADDECDYEYGYGYGYDYLSTFPYSSVLVLVLVLVLSQFTPPAVHSWVRLIASSLTRYLYRAYARREFDT